MKFLFPIFALFLFCKFCIAEELFRTWTSSDGRKIQAKFIEMVGKDTVKIKIIGGREFELEKDKISEADWKYVEKIVAEQDARNAKDLFNLPEPFNDYGKGGIIIVSIKGEVRVFQNIGNSDQNVSVSNYEPQDKGTQEVKLAGRNAILGESLPVGSTIITRASSEADLLLTNGSIAKLKADSKLVLNNFWQKNFEPSAKKVTQLEEEVSSSRVALKLEIGDLVVDVKKLNKDSSFMVESQLGVAGIRGTQFGLSVDAGSTELAVLEGSVSFKDTKKKIENVKTAQSVIGAEGGASVVTALPETKKIELANDIADSKKESIKYDLNQIAIIVDGYKSKPNFIVKSALDMELIWCPPGSFIMGSPVDEKGRGFDENQHKVTLTKGFYLGKYEVTQEQYHKVMRKNPHKRKQNDFPVYNVSWKEADLFCKRLNIINQRQIPLGFRFGLPTEAQWEYACRAGTTTAYSWGSKKAASVNYYPVFRVGTYRSNPWGFYDMHRNVGEWVKYSYYVYPTAPVIDPTGGVYRGVDNIARGVPSSGSSRSAYRRKSGHAGFRLCLSSF